MMYVCIVSDEGREFVRTICVGGAAEVEGSRWQARADTARGEFARHELL